MFLNLTATPDAKPQPIVDAVAAVPAPAAATEAPAVVSEAETAIAAAAAAAGAAAVAADEEAAAAQLDAGFTISLVSPGLEPLQIQVSSMELVQEIHQLLMDREDTCHRTCFSLQLDGVTLDNFAELKNIDGLTEGSVVRVAEEPYTMREARIHVRHVRDLLKSMDTTDAYNGHDCFSLTFLNTITSADGGGDAASSSSGGNASASSASQSQKKHPKSGGGAGRPDSVDCTPPEYIMPGTKERPLLPLQPGIAKNAKGSPSIKVLTTSAWNPPPGPRKLHGDLMYLYVVTLEEKRFHITACPRGFYINQSTEDSFNPRADAPSHLCHSLIELLAQISPAFKRSFAQMQKKRTLRHPFERVATPYQVYTWAAPVLENTLDAIRAEDTFSSKLGYEEHIPGQTRDWNEELQTTRELPRKGLNERLLRERAIFKVHSDFVTAATRGAMAVIDGNVMAINPGEDPKMQMFIWNNIFFSLGFDVRDHYKELGGDAAAFVAPRNDLHGVRVYSAVDVEGLYTLGTVIVDYRGYRVTAQSIIPGILEREQEQSVVYGSIDFGKNVLGHEKYLELLSKAGQQLKVLPHSVRTEKDDAAVDICSSVECKGIIGNDGRYYILDLLRTFPPDVNFLRSTDVEYHADVQAMGFPIEHKHKLCCLRQELLDAFVEDRYVVFIKYAAYHLQQIGATLKQQKQKKEEEEREKRAQKAIEASGDAAGNNNEVATDAVAEKTAEVDERPAALTDAAKQLMDTLADGITSDEKQAADSKEVVKRACAAVGSLKEYEFDIRFNADAFTPGIQHVEPASEYNTLQKQRKLVSDAAQFLVLTQIPTFVRECLEHTSAPMDGVTLTEALHNKGINVRYLGKVTALLAKVPRLDYLHTIAVQELILRAAKHIFVVTVQNTELMNLSAAISHFLNCFLTTTSQTLSPVLGHDELTGGRGAGGAAAKRRNKNANKKNGSGSTAAATGVTVNGGGAKAAAAADAAAEWAAMTQKTLWQQIKREAKQYWDYELQCDNIEAAVEQFGFHKLSLLRAFCQKVGVQVLLREYHFESRNKPTFGEDDIVNVFPIVKHINPRASDAYNFYTTGQTKIQQGQFKEGFDLISEALNLLNNVYGAMHSENAQCLRMLARLSYIMGDPQEALTIQQRAVLMSERVNGIDHPYTISEYVSK